MKDRKVHSGWGNRISLQHFFSKRHRAVGITVLLKNENCNFIDGDYSDILTWYSDFDKNSWDDGLQTLAALA